MLPAATSQLIGKHQARKMDFSITGDENGLRKFPAAGEKVLLQRVQFVMLFSQYWKFNDMSVDFYQVRGK